MLPHRLPFLIQFYRPGFVILGHSWYGCAVTTPHAIFHRCKASARLVALTKIVGLEPFNAEAMKTLARRIERELQVGEWKHCAVYEHDLKRFWPLHQKDREAKI